MPSDEREHQRQALLTALQHEIRLIESVAGGDLDDYGGHGGTARSRGEAGGRHVEGAGRYQLAFPWTPLPDSAIEQAIREAGLLRLSVAQIQRIQSLREKIRRVNTLVLHKANLLPALIQVPIRRDGWSSPAGELPWALHRANNLNDAIIDELSGIRKECIEIGRWWESARTP